jgi:ribokinase
MLMKRPIVVIGSSNTDMIVQAAHIPRPGETVLGGEFSTAAGGKGANQAVGAARAGGSAVFLARVGADMFGERALDGLRKDGIDVSRVILDSEAPSGVALIIVDERGENSIAVAPGANGRLSSDDVRAVSDLISGAALVLMQLEIPLETVRTAARIAHDARVRVILNPAPAQLLDGELLRLIDIITPNETEAELLTGVAVSEAGQAHGAALKLHQSGIATVLITLGARGVYVSSPEFTGVVAGFPVEAVDTTAAGDVFNGVLAVGLAEGKGLEESARLACAAAALSVTKRGAQPSAPIRSEIDRLKNR